jgi:RND family efflux transporter MFP subunit
VSQLEAAEAQVAQAQDALERTRLLAPAAGTVYKRTAEPGETIGSGSPVAILDTTGALVVKAGATLREVQTLALGQAATLLEEDGASSSPGRVSSIATTPNPADGLYVVEVTPQAQERFRPGTLLYMRFSGAKTQGVRIPLEALVHRQDRDFVFLVEAGPRVRQIPVEVDHTEGGDVAVRSGLLGGERVVAEGAYFLQNGQTVRVLD